MPEAPPQPPPREATAEELAAAERMERKQQAILNVTATVYLNGKRTITEIKWRNHETGNLEYRAFSNADFRYLTQLHHLESETTVYSWFPFVYVVDLAAQGDGEEVPLPANLAFSETQAEYFIDSNSKSTESESVTLGGLDYLHAYYQLNAEALKADYERRESENRARELELAQRPPEVLDTTIYFWPIKNKSTR